MLSYTEGHVLDETSSASDADCALTNASNVGHGLTCASTGGEGYKGDGPNVLTNASNVGDDLTCASTGGEDCKDDGSSGCLPKDDSASTELLSSNESYMIPARVGVSNGGGRGGGNLSPVGQHGHIVQDCLDVEAQNQLFSSEEELIEMGPERIAVSGVVKDMSNDKWFE